MTDCSGRRRASRGRWSSAYIRPPRVPSGENNTLGNFTWVPRGCAPDLGTAERKKELLRMTRYGLELVKDFALIERWTAEEIDNRSRRLGQLALQVWPRA